MEQNAFRLLREMEGSWWYRGRALIVAAALSRLGAARFGTALDFGAGYGGMFPVLKEHSVSVCAFEPNAAAQEAAKSRGYTRVYDSAEAAFAETYDCIAVFDVVEHIEDDRAFLISARNALSAHGRILITVPAYRWLWSEHDVANRHFRRYTNRALVRLLVETGYRVEFSSYWNSILFPVAAATRLFGASGAGALTMPPFIDAIFLFLVRIETMLLRLFSFPFGLSIIAVATPQR